MRVLTHNLMLLYFEIARPTGAFAKIVTDS